MTNTHLLLICHAPYSKNRLKMYIRKPCNNAEHQSSKTSWQPKDPDVFADVFGCQALRAEHSSQVVDQEKNYKQS